jgi:hypothetical protein
MISVQGFKINLNFEPQISKNGRPFRLSGISLVTTKPAIWIDNNLRHGTIYSFRYVGTDEFFGFEFAPDGKFLNKIQL